MTDDVTSLVQMLADLPPGGSVQVPAARLGQLFDAGGELSDGAAANLRAFAEQHGCTASYSADNGRATFTKGGDDVGNG